MNIGLIFERRTNDSHVIEFCDLYYVILIAGGSWLDISSRDVVLLVGVSIGLWAREAKYKDSAKVMT